VAGTSGGDDPALVSPDSLLRLGKVLKKLEHPVKVIYREEVGPTTKYKDAVEAFEYMFAALAR